MPEDILTELLAHVLSVDDVFRDAVVDEIWQGRPGAAPRGPVKIRTQVETIQGRRPDLELHFEAPQFRVWFEVKDQARQGVLQLADYKADLNERYGDNQLLVLLARDPDAVDAEPHAGYGMRWQSIADIAERVGNARGKRGWRTSAMRRGADALQQTLADFVSYLEQRGVAVDNRPVSDDEISVAAKAGLLIRRLNRLLDAAVEKAPGFADATQSEGAYGPVFLWRVLRSSDTASPYDVQLAGDRSGYRALSFNPLNEIGEPGDPAFTAGVWFDKSKAVVRDALSVLRRKLEDNEITVAVNGSETGITASYRMQDLVNAHPTFEDQAFALGTWVEQKLVLIDGLLNS